MIRINLLPFRAARKRENIRRQVSIYGLIILLAVLMIGYRFITLSAEVSGLKTQETGKRTELDGFKPELEELKKAEAMAKEIKVKLDVITELEKAKTGPVLLLSAIADAVPRDKLWLTSMTDTDGKLALTGIAMDNETVALFMDNLKAAKDMITFVELVGVNLKEYPQYGLKTSEFTLDCTTSAFKETKKTQTKK
jgi:type IV pilus assembly protein PilN